MTPRANPLPRLDILLLLALLAVPVCWLMLPLGITIGERTLKLPWVLLPLAAAVALFVLRAAVKAGDLERGETRRGWLERPVVKKCVLAMIMTYGCFAAVEGALIVAKFRVNMAPVVFELDDAAGVTERSEGYSDPELLWRFRPGEKYHGRMVNRLGYREREVEAEKKPGTIRIICMGDSVTAQGEPGYAQLLHDRLNANPPTTNGWEAFNMAVYGYSAMQGLRVFQLEASRLAPDFVTIYYGWNDHWLELQTDRARMAVKMNPWVGRVYNRLKEKRIVMLLAHLANRQRGVDTKARERAGFRVPPEEYVEVLREFIDEVRAVGAQPILITAARRDVFPTKDKHPEESRKLSFNEVHDQYVELTRQVAREQNVELLDLHALWQAPEHDPLFMRDGIHFQQPGLEKIAAALDERIRTLVNRPAD